MPVGLNRTQEERELQKVLASRTFSKAPNLARLLRYICTQYWEGAAGELKEYRIAVEALGRSPDFDPLTNSTVRVELHRLRQKLKQFYEGEGLDHEIAVTLNTGNYSPTFTRRSEALLSGKASAAATGNGIQDPHRDATPTNGRNRLAGPAAGRWKNRTLWISGLVGTALLVFLLAKSGGHWKPQPTVNTSTASQGSLAPTATASPPLPLDSARIVAGYSKRDYIDREGNVWSGDRYDHGGTAGMQFFHRPVSRTLDPTLFETYRAGEFSYDIPLKKMPYEVRLYFMETKFGPGTLAGGGEASRIFDVWINGKMALEDFDPYTDAGGDFVADVRAFKNISPASDGFLHIKFTSVKDKPFVNAIEVWPDAGGKLLPIRIVAQDNSFTDHEGRLWKPDSYFSGGELAVNSVRVQGTLDPGLYAGERYGIFSYALPVAPGRYAVTLRFAETFFGPGNPGNGGAGSRIFNVFCNGRTLLRNFDIIKEAGGDNRAVVRTFRGIEPNSQGKILLEFVPVKNYALVNSIQVADQSS